MATLSPFFQLALQAATQSRNAKNAASAQGASQLFQAFRALMQPQIEQSQFNKSVGGMQNESQSPVFPGPPNEVGDEIRNLPAQLLGMGTQDQSGMLQNPVRQAQGQLAGAPDAIARLALQAGDTVLRGQELQQMVGDKKLQPTLIEAFMQGKGMAPGLQYKQEARQFYRQLQLSEIKSLIDSGQSHLAEAFIRPMKPEEQQSLIQRHVQMLLQGTALQRAQAGPYLDTFAPAQAGPTPAPAAGGYGATAAQGAGPGTVYSQAMQGIPATGQTIQERFGQALQNPKLAPGMLIAYGAASGQPVTPQVLQQEMQRNLGLRGMDIAEREMKKQQASGTSQAAQSTAQQPPPQAQGQPQASAPSNVLRQPPSPPQVEAIKAQADAIAQKIGIPPAALRAINNVENAGWDPGIDNKQYGPMGGMGLGQIVPSTWRRMLVSDTIKNLPPADRPKNDPYDVRSNLTVGASLLKELYAYYGDWPHAFAAYQAGQGPSIPKGGEIPTTLTYQVRGKTITIHPRAYSDKAMANMQAAEKGESQPTWTLPGVVPNPVIAQAQEQASPSAGQAPPQAPYTLPSYASFKPSATLTGMNFTPSGPSLEMKFTTPEEKSGAYLQGALINGGWRQFVPALKQMSAEAAAPVAPRLLVQLREQASNQAYWEARNQLGAEKVPLPERHIQALERASAATGGFFTGQQLGDLQDPVALKYAEAQAGYLAPLEGKRTAQAATEQVRRLGQQRGEEVQRGAEATTQALAGQEVREVISNRGGHAFYTGADNEHDFLQRYPQTAKYSTFSQDQAQGHAAEVDAKELSKVEALSGTLDSLSRLTTKLNTIYGPGGIYEKIGGAWGRLGAGMAGTKARITQENPQFSAAEREYKQLITPIARTLGTESGRIPFAESRQFYAGAVPDIEGFMPDRPEVARALVNDLAAALEKRIGIAINEPSFTIPSRLLTKPTFGVGASAPTTSGSRVK